MKSAISDDLKSRMQAPWEAGDFGAIARMIGAPAANGFAQGVDAPPDASILDIACGTGGVTIPMARRGFRLTGLDLSGKLLAEARERAVSERLTIQFDEGLAEELPYADSCFDAVVSMFGVMFSARPDLVAAEMARVLRPNGRLVLGSWMGSGFSGKMRAVVTPYLPAPSVNSASPEKWGEDEWVRQRLAPWFTDIETSPVPVTWEMPIPPRETAAFFIQSSGQLQLMLPRLNALQSERLCREIGDLFVESNRAEHPDRSTVIDNCYLHVSAARER